MRRIAVLGGGISGLAAAHRLQELTRERGIDTGVRLYEASPHTGGCVQTVHSHGFTMELGPDSLLIDKPAAANLVRRLGLDGEIVDMRAEFKGARIVHRGRLHRIPPDFRLFSPTSLPALLGSGIFSAAGIARAAMEPFVPKRTGGDESLASFVTRRFGREILERLAQPLIGGIYSGDPARLSMRAALPQFLDMEQRYGSIMRAMQAAREPRPAMRLVSLRGGLGALADALRARSGEAAIQTGARVRALTREQGAWGIAFDDGSAAQADAIVCCLPAYAAAQLVRPHDAKLADALESIRYNSIATVNLTYDAASNAHLPRSTGFVVPYVERRRITAATFATQKYPFRSPGNALLLRAFIGGALQPELLAASDAQLARMAHEELAALTGIRGEPGDVIVTRWERLLPEYGVGHVELVADAERRAAAIPGLALAGSAYRGVGVPDCIATGEAAAVSAFGYVTR